MLEPSTTLEIIARKTTSSSKLDRENGKVFGFITQINSLIIPEFY